MWICSKWIFDEDSGFIADRERLELLQAEGQALVEKFQKDQEHDETGRKK